MPPGRLPGQELEHWNTLAGQFHQVTGQRAVHQLAVETARTKLETDHTNLLTQQRGVQSMASQMAELEQKLAELHNRDQQLTATLESRPILQAEINQLVQELSDLNAEKTALKPRMDEIKKRIDGLVEASGSLCPLCGQPLSPADRERMVDELNAEGKTYGDRFREINNTLLPATQQQRTKKETELNQLVQVDQNLRTVQRQISGLQENLNNLQTQIRTWEQSGALRLAELNDILAKKAYAESDWAALAELDAQLAALGYDAKAHQAVLQAEQSGRDSENRLYAVGKCSSCLTTTGT